MAVRAVRGATSLDSDTVEAMHEAVGELLEQLMQRNGLIEADLISLLLTSTPDLTSCFPASAARAHGLSEVPLMSAVEVDVPDAPKRIVRVLAHVETELPRAQVSHVFLRGARVLRPDLADDA